MKNCNQTCSGAVRTGFEDTLWQNLDQLCDKCRSLTQFFTVVTCSPTLNVYCDIISGSLALPSPSFGVYQCNKLDMRTFWEQNFYTNTFYFIWFNFLSVGIVDILLQSAGTGKYATPTRHLRFHFAPLAVSYQLFP